MKNVPIRASFAENVHLKSKLSVTIRTVLWQLKRTSETLFGGFLRTVNAALDSALPSTLCIDVVVSKMADFLPSRSVLSAFFPNCLLTRGEAEQLRKSKEIDKCIHRDKTYVKRLVKILLLGAGESGKSTFLKQMRIIHGQDFDQKAKEEFRATIFSNVIKGKPTLYRLLFTYWNRFVPTCVEMGL